MMKYKRWLALPVLLLVVLLTWLFWPDRRLAQAKALQKELFSPQARSMPAEQRREKWQQYRQIQEKLTPAQREALSAESRKRRQAEMNRYFAMTPAEKTRHLDEQIRRMEQGRQKMQAKGGAGAGKGGQGRAGIGGTGGVPGGGINASSGAAKQPGRVDKSTPASRDQGRQRFLDSSSPAQRAQVTQYMKDLNARRAQLGLPPMGRGGAGPRR